MDASSTQVRPTTGFGLLLLPNTSRCTTILFLLYSRFIVTSLMLYGNPYSTIVLLLPYCRSTVTSLHFIAAPLVLYGVSDMSPDGMSAGLLSCCHFDAQRSNFRHPQSPRPISRTVDTPTDHKDPLQMLKCRRSTNIPRHERWFFRHDWVVTLARARSVLLMPFERLRSAKY